MSNVIIELQRRQWQQVEGWKTRSLRTFCEEKAFYSLRYSWSCRDVVQHKQSTLAISFSCDGHFMASSHLTHEIVIYHTRPHIHILHVLAGHLATGRSPWCLTFHPSLPHRLLSGCLGGTISLWNVLTGECVTVWSSGISSPINSLVFIPSCPSHFLVAYDTWLCRMHCQDSKMETIWRSRTSSITSKVRLVLHHPDSNKILTAITNSINVCVVQNTVPFAGGHMLLMNALNKVRSSYRLQLYTYGSSHGPDLEDSVHGLICLSARVVGPRSVVLTSQLLFCSTMVGGSQAQISIYSILPQTFGQCLHSTLLTPNYKSAVSLELSPFHSFLLVGMSGRKNAMYFFPIEAPVCKVFKIHQTESSLKLEPCCRLSGPFYANIALWLPSESGEDGVCVGTQQGSVLRCGRVRKGREERDHYQLIWYSEHEQPQPVL